MGLGGLLLGSASATWLGVTSSRVEAARGAGIAGAAGRDQAQDVLPDWALPMVHMPAEELLLQAGDFERLSARNRRDRGAAVGFERLLSIALDSKASEADTAAACALRSLVRLDRPDLLAFWAPAVQERVDLVRANEEVNMLLSRILQIRRRDLPR